MSESISDDLHDRHGTHHEVEFAAEVFRCRGCEVRQRAESKIAEGNSGDGPKVFGVMTAVTPLYGGERDG